MNVRKSINKGADKNAKNYFGRTPLHLASQKGQILRNYLHFNTQLSRVLFCLGFESIVKFLIDSQAEIDIEDNYGKFPIHFAAQNGK